MLWQRARLVIVLAVSLTVGAAGQSGHEISTEQSADKPVHKAVSQLVEENEYYRVFRADLVPDAVSRVDQHGRDTVIMALGEGLALTTRKAINPERLRDGEARFLSGDSTPQIVNVGNNLPQLLVIELKRHWDAEVRAC